MSELYLDDDLTQNNYFCNLREFRNGDLEMVLKPVRPMKQEMMEAVIDGTSYAAACAEKGESSRYVTSARRKGADEEDQISDSRKEENQARAVRRSKQNIRFYAKNMRADRLFTLTVRRNEQDREVVKAVFKRFVRLVRSGFTVKTQNAIGETVRIKYDALPGWNYLAVLEKQQRGAYHVHCAVAGWQPIKLLRAAWYKALGGNGGEVGAETPGQVDVTNPDKAKWGHTGRQWRVKKLVQYLVKYMSKTFDTETSEKHRYWRAADLDTPKPVRMWVTGTDMLTAIKSAIGMLQFHCGLHPRFDHWLSTGGDTYWLSGVST